MINIQINKRFIYKKRRKHSATIQTEQKNRFISNYNKLQQLNKL